MENFRTFIGIPVRVGDEFLRAREKLVHALEGERISWVAPHRYHVTLRFIGDTGMITVNAVRNALREKIEVPPRSNVRLSHPGSFGPGKKPRVVWIGFEDTMVFDTLKTAVDKALDACGIPPVDQPFRAHLTLGRVRNLNDIQRFYRSIEAMNDDFSCQVLLERLVFYRSEPGDGGPVYSPLEQLPFRD